MWQIDNSFALKIIFPWFLILLVTERVINTFGNRNRSQKTYKVFHKRFFYVLLGAYLTIVFICSVSFFINTRINFLVSLIGVAILLTGIICRRAAISSLNEYWSIFIEIKENQRIIRDGIYRYLKHPYYTAVVLELLGFSLVCNSYWGIWLTIAIQVPLLLIRIYYENRILKVYGKRLGFDI